MPALVTAPLKLSDFDYELPPELIAAYPSPDRAAAKLIRVDKKSGAFEHHRFRDLVSFLNKGDLLVLNNTKVMPARIFGRKPTGGKVEALLLKELEDHRWEALLRPGGRIQNETRLLFHEKDVRLEAIVQDDSTPYSGKRILRFYGGNVKDALAKIGHIPLPPYIDRPDTELDRERYQTVYAQKEGAVAAPTAGLHFDRPLLDALLEKGVLMTTITLHVGYGTFQTIAVEDLSKHKMFEEEYEINQEAAEAINKAREEKRRIIACGTTSVRALESAAGSDGRVHAKKGATQLFIYPPYSFKVVDGLITNFHLPKSTLLLLVAAFLGRNALFQVYSAAIASRYRFYSYGDAMLIL